MRRLYISFLALLFVSVIVDLYMIFIYAPIEKIMGVVQKIFYFHISAAWVGFFAFFVVFILSILYLMTRNEKWNLLALSSAEIGVIFITMVLVTGPLWARPIWNTWWTWDPRLTTTLVLWFMYLAYLILQGSGGYNEQRARFSAVYGIIAFINVPLVFFSIRWWRTIHPVIIEKSRIGLTSEMLLTLLFSLFTFSLLYFYLLNLRYRVLKVSASIARCKDRLSC